MWMRWGQQVEVPSPGQNQKVAAFGGINYATGEHLAHVPAVPKGGKNAAQFLVWFGKLVAHARRRGKRIILAIDNGSIHTAKKVLAVLEDLTIRKLIQVLWLPKYASDLNEQERIWKYAKEQGIANAPFSGRDTLRKHVVRVLDALNRDPKDMMMTVLGRKYREGRIGKDLFRAT